MNRRSRFTMAFSERTTWGMTTPSSAATTARNRI